MRRIVDTGRGVSDELQQALAGLKKIEEDFVATVSKVAESASERVRPELRELVGGDARRHRDRPPGRAPDGGVHLLGHRGRGRVRHALRADCGRRAHRHGGRARQVRRRKAKKTLVAADAAPYPRHDARAAASARDHLGLHPARARRLRAEDRHRRRAGARGPHLLRWGEAGESVKLDPPQRMRMALEELGPAFVKLGQVMATRVDLFPPSWIAEFEKLQADVPPVPFEELLPELERALGRSPFEVFRDLDTRRLRRGLDRAGAPREAAGRHAGRAQGAAAGRAREDRGGPAAAAARGGAGRVRDAGGAALPTGGDRGAVRASRSSARSTSPPRRATSSASRRTSPAIPTSSSRASIPNARATCCWCRSTSKAYRPPIRPRSKRRGWTESCSPRAAPTPS